MSCTKSKKSDDSTLVESVYIDSVKMWCLSFCSVYSPLWQAAISSLSVRSYWDFKHTTSSSIPKLANAVSNTSNIGATLPALVCLYFCPYGLLCCSDGEGQSSSTSPQPFPEQRWATACTTSVLGQQIWEKSLLGPTHGFALPQAAAAGQAPQDWG